MSTPEVSKFQFVNFSILESYIKVNGSGLKNVEVSFAPSGIIQRSANRFILTLEVSLKEVEDNFEIKIISKGIFKFPEGSDIERYKDSFFTTNAPAIVFPYIRAYISSLTALSGIQTVNIPTFNMTPLREQLLENIKEIDE